MNRTRPLASLALLAGLLPLTTFVIPPPAGALAGGLAAGEGAAESAGSWRTDPAWHQGKAEWALYDAERPLYGVVRRYEATIFTNRQHMDPATTTKADDWQSPGAFEVFKHNVSELIPTERYTYRFLTTAFVRADTLEPYKVVFASQEDCGSTYKEFLVGETAVRAEQFCYFPGAGRSSDEYRRVSGLAFHDTLSLTLRDYPFDDPDRPALRLKLVPDQTDTHETGQEPEEARVEYAGRESVTVPLGTIDAHHLRVTHQRDGGVTASDYWFAADPGARHVMVRYEGPYGVHYRLKKHAWWAYWSEPRPE